MMLCFLCRHDMCSKTNGVVLKDTTSSANEVAEEWWAWERITKLTGM